MESTATPNCRIFRALPRSMRHTSNKELRPFRPHPRHLSTKRLIGSSSPLWSEKQLPAALRHWPTWSGSLTPQPRRKPRRRRLGTRTKSPHSANPALVEKGKALFENGPQGQGQGVIACQACHGPQGEGLANAPRLRGQNSRYLINQLMRYRAGDRPDAPDMTSGAKQLDSEQIRAVSAFLASQ